MITRFHLICIDLAIKKNSIARTIPVTGTQQLNFRVEEVSFECIIGHSFKIEHFKFPVSGIER